MLKASRFRTFFGDENHICISKFKIFFRFFLIYLNFRFFRFSARFQVLQHVGVIMWCDHLHCGDVHSVMVDCSHHFHVLRRVIPLHTAQEAR